MDADAQFRRRILLVDGDARFLHTCSEMLYEQGYEVLTARDGFAALCVLRGGHPDLLITELDLPRMSGFELLSVVRSRFPQIAVIALSNEFTPVSVPHEAICDCFLAKGPNIHFELVEETRRLISESPLRSTRAKSEIAPVWIPHSTTGYIVLTCPECLRSFSAVQPPKPGVANETCVCCGAKVTFDMSSVEVAPVPPPASVEDRLHRAQAKSRQLRAEAQILRDKRRKS
ncbi:MAG TPA: response regulator [Terriglobales bacterium]|nr:response regulator [Terriglobales bacterium]